MTKTVETASTGDEAAAIATLTLAFAVDPMTRWSWPHPRAYLEAFPKFARAFGGAAFAKGSAHRVDGCAGVALWLPPGVEPDGAALGALMQSTITGPALMDGAGIMQQMMAFHPEEPHWYLPLIGIDPQHQGRGLGGALLDHALALADRDGVPAYLESSNPRNIGLYERHGFEQLGRIQNGSSPTLVPMLRKPRRRG
ncbi:MAG: GNAT family N-acetyltransferase [Reyranella sp.]